MTPPRTARLAAVSAAAILGIASLGCGYVQNAIDTANTLSEFSDRLGKAAALTYTAEYTFTSGRDGTDAGAGNNRVTLVQKPPNTAVIAGDSRMIFTANHMLMCEKQGGRVECQRAPSPAGATGATDTGLVSAVAGTGFVTPELALGLVAAAALLPNTDVSTSERKFAGQKALCADVTGIDASQVQDPTQEMLRDFSVCVTESGVLGSFSGTSNAGDKVAMELVSFDGKASAKAFVPPAGAKVVDVTQIQR